MSATPVAVGTHRELVAIPSNQHDDWIIHQAIVLLERRIFKAGPTLLGPVDVRDYLRLKLASEFNEIFAAVFLDTQFQVLAYEPLFQGTVDEAAVYPRVVVQRALAINAAAVLFAHNHPSGGTTPSEADRLITKRLKAALATVDVRVLDHFIVGKGEPFSLAEAGLM
ncbi:DNA repair protein RadC [Xanthomonas campestris pv. phormiicola]|nr:DNA repair protein RadC [Xanthomonas campestris pv. phormiicola]UYC17416.1 DNA repair protein RadC [Xanthomonas campestris pv. phormiicola]